MVTVEFVQAAAVAGGGVINLPAWVHPIAQIVAASIKPLANAGAASVTSPIQETGLATGVPAAGQVTAPARNQIRVGDAVPANSAITLEYAGLGEATAPAAGFSGVSG